MNKGFIATSILFSVVIIFLVIINSRLNMIINTEKNILSTKEEIKQIVNQDSKFESRSELDNE